MATQNQTFPNGPAFTNLGYKASLKLFAVDDGVLPSQPGWVLVGDIAAAASAGALATALPATNGLLAGTGAAGAAKAATAAMLIQLLTTWAATAPKASPGDGSPWLNGGLLSFAKS